MDCDLAKIQKLKSIENWSVWKFQVRVILNSHDAWEVANGQRIRPVVPIGVPNEGDLALYERNLAAWKKADAIVQKVIATSVGEQPMLHIINCASGQQMWQKLSDVYEQRSESNIHMLQQKWYGTSIEGNDSIATYIAKLEDIAHRLNLLEEQIPESMIITKILMSLPQSYRHFVSAWESSPIAERTLVNLTSRLTIEESRNVFHKVVEPKAFAARSYDRKTKGKFFKKSGGTSEKCFKCNETGHWARECPKGNSTGNTKKDNDYNKPKPQGQGLVSEALSTACGNGVEKSDWVLDSGASDHMCNVREWFTTYETLNEPTVVRIGDGSCIEVHGKGIINIKMFDESKWNLNHLVNVLYVPELKYNLFSVGAALDKGLKMVSTQSVCKLVDGDRTVAVGVRRNKLYMMKFEPTSMSEETAHANIATTNSLKNWHERLAHQNYRHVKNVLDNFEIKVTNTDEVFCDACALGKIHRLPFPVSTSITQAIGEIIHVDLCGPMQVNSIGGSKYFLLLKDDFSHFRTVYFIKSKTEVGYFVEDFLRKAEKQCPGGVRVLRTDNGTEIVNQKIKELTHNLGIRHQRTVAYTPEQNGAAERENRTIIEAARTIMQAGGFDSKFWAEAVNTANFVLNATGTSSVKDVTPFELWHQRKPNIKNLKVFGEEVYTHIPKEKRRKLDAKGKRGFFVGYEEDVKGYRIWYPDDLIIRTSRDVFFTGRMAKPSTSETNSDGNEEDWFQLDDQSLDLVGAVEELVENTLEQPEVDIANDVIPIEVAEEDSEPIDKRIEEEGCRRLRDRTLIRRPNRYDSYAEVCNVMVAESGEEPLTYKDAMKSVEAEKWKAAMHEELEALAKNNVWNLIESPNDRRIVDNKWTFKLKRDANGNVQRYKARLVARGFTQRKGIDFTETFSPVVRFDSIRAMLAIAASEGLHLEQFDVKTAFLYGHIDEQIFMKQPEGYDDNSGKVCKLNRSLYGLKQSSRCWNKCFTDFLKSHNLTATQSDPCVFINHEKDKRLILAIYVDDGLMMCSNQQQMDNLIIEMRKRFEITNNGVNLFLGLQIKQGGDGSIFVHQEMYVKKILDKFNMANANPVSVPSDPHQELNIYTHSGNEDATSAPYREAIGSLMYLSTATRPDITFAVNVASRYLDTATKIHWNAVKRIFKYLKGTTNFGLKFERDQEKHICVYSDADYAGDTETRRSTTGVIVKYGSGSISWSSHKQQAVALSTTEAEYMAASHAAKEIIWMKTLFGEMLNITNVPTTLFLDNQSAINLIKNPVYHKRTKHIDVRYHHLRDQYEEKVFMLEYVESKDQQADILTKPLPRTSFQYQRKSIGVQELTK